MAAPSSSYTRLMKDVAFHARNAARQLEVARGRAPADDAGELVRALELAEELRSVAIGCASRVGRPRGVS